MSEDLFAANTSTTPQYDASAIEVLEGLEPEVTLGVDVLIPSQRVAAILREFQFAFPTVWLGLYAEAVQREGYRDA